MSDKTARALATAAVIAAGILTFPFEALPLGPPGIDSGWQWVINVASSHNWVFGRDVVFTYGPLGWLATPQDVSHHLASANGLRAALQILMVTCGLLFLSRFKRPAPVLVFSALWIVAGATGLRFEGFVVLVIALLLLTSLRIERSWPAVTAGLITGLVPLIKTSLGIAAAATLFLGLGLIWRHRGFKGPLVSITASGAVATLFVLLLFPSIGFFFEWVDQALEVVDGYAAAASIVGPQLPLAVAAVLLLAIVAGGVFLSLRIPDFCLSALVLAPGLLITFRLAFVRQDGHQFLFLPFVIALLGIAALGTSRRVALWILGAGAVVVVTGSLSGLMPFGPMDLPRVLATEHRGPSNLARLVRSDDTRIVLERESRRNLRDLKLPRSWIESMDPAPNGITVVPWELMYAPANDLPFKPLRTMQLYSAYTPALDRLTAEGLSGSEAPDFVLDDFAPVGKRRALFDAPQTWRTLFLEYRLLRSTEANDLLMLARRKETLTHRWQDLGETTLQVGGPGISVPRSPHMVFAEIDAPLNVFGRLNKAFFRVPLLLAIFHRVDGNSTWVRLIPETAREGILINHFPQDFDDYAGLWSGHRAIAVSRLQIAGPGKRNFDRSFGVHWRALIPGDVGKEPDSKERTDS